MRKLAMLLTMLLFLSPTAFARPEIHINIPDYLLTLVDNGQMIKQYHVAVGTPYMPTPTGKFMVSYKEKYPTWYPGSEFVDKTPVPPGPDNPLGTRWIEFQPGYGIHGTNKAWSIDYPVSDGCVRMFNVDAEELYELVEIGTPVIISYQTMAVFEKTDGLYLRVNDDIYNKAATTKEQFALLIAPYQALYPKITEPKWPIVVEAPNIYELKIAASQQNKKTP
ncbi:MAG: L,D-transpeptidase [Negativicutes bacterium]|nr:L,D-transpeptidase [Negativicutes bacterium]